MKIETKFYVNDEVFVLHDNMPKLGVVAEINITVDKIGVTVSYYVFSNYNGTYRGFADTQVFRSAKEAQHSRGK